MGLALAWPLQGPDWTWAAGALGGASAALLGLWAARAQRTGARTLQGLGLVVLLGLAVGQRLHEPLVGLFSLIGLTLTLQRGGALLPRREGDTGSWPALLVAGLALAVPEQLPLPRGLLLLPLLLLGAAELLELGRSYGRHHQDLLDTLLGSPARLLVLSFAGLVLLGTGLLLLPFASRAPGSIAGVDALFTAVSAICVTGLIVLDTPVDFTGFGQAVLLVLFQLGGLGIMTFATAAAVLLGRRLGVRQESLAASLIGDPGARADLEAALRVVLKVTLLTEGLGAALLTPLFMASGDGPLEAAWRALFTSVSAFCNAGFALQSDSLMPYQSRPGVLWVVSAVIIVGGLGPAVVAAVLARRRSTLHTRLVLVSTAALLLVPTLGFLVLEWRHTLAGMGLVDRLTNAWFQSVTLRTAGFNSLDFGAIQPATWTLCILTMFVGGSPGSTAGGAKTTTMAVLLLAVTAAIRGQPEAEAFGRRIPHRTVHEAAAITTVFVLSCIAALAALQVTQQIPLDRALFEVVSALATVGVSMGATAELDAVGKFILIACMFAGRVGPLTLFVSLIGRSRVARRYPLEAVQIG
ncbi:MAG: hypothetical protein H6740_04170 [Alphaproteobacteria bacterium]|nr:hypothetical protein [Alphaproteobacteria bacterium]